jgi:hypothetical protein
MERCEDADWIRSAQITSSGGSCENGNKHSGTIRGGGDYRTR